MSPSYPGTPPTPGGVAGKTHAPGKGLAGMMTDSPSQV
jgi:hypothetical protein